MGMLVRRLHGVTALLLLLLVVVACGAPSASGQATTTAITPTPVPTAVLKITSADLDVAQALEGTLERLYAMVNPSVVNIRVVQKQQISGSILPGFPFPGAPREYYRRGLGSGFVWDKEGHIVTNNHVVEGADEISVTFYDGTIVTGRVVGTDPSSDLAVVKVDVPPDRLQPVQVADSTQVKVGQLAIAIGNPFGLQGTLTTGVVSAVGRTLPAGSATIGGPNYTIPDVIQTDASINPGNSGGVLVDIEGRLIGVTSAIISPVGTSAGIGFAIPSAIVQKVVPSLIQTGRYEHPWIGITITSLTPKLAEAMGLDSNQRGALVIDVTADSPAAKAGLRGSDRQVTIEGQSVRVGGDVIIAIEGQEVKQDEDLIAYLERHTSVGQTVTLTVLRGGKEQQVPLTLGARPQTVSSAQGEAVGGAWLGIYGLTLTPEIAGAMDLPADQRGVLVERVVRGSPADEAGLRGSYQTAVINGRPVLIGGDVITALNGEAVTTLEDLQQALQRARPGDEVSLALLRDGEPLEVRVTLGARPEATP